MNNNTQLINKEKNYINKNERSVKNIEKLKALESNNEQTKLN